MLNLWQVIALMGVVGLLVILAGMGGAYIMFKGSRAVPGEQFLGGPPKGQVFSIPDIEDEEEAPDEAQKGIVQERLNQFLSKFEGDKV